jgi:hypothetical protein
MSYKQGYIVFQQDGEGRRIGHFYMPMSNFGTLFIPIPACPSQGRKRVGKNTGLKKALAAL